MNKYIDADLLRKEIEKWKSLLSQEKEKKDASKTDKLSLGGRIAMLEEILVFIDSLQQEQPEVDWGTFRREAAKDIFCAMIHHQNSTEPIEVSIAIDIADELIKQLKEERNERSVAYER